jgi:hypothetical protein
VEVYGILTGMKGSTRAAAIAEMIEQKMVPCKERALYNLLKKDVSAINEGWGQIGRPGILDDNEMTERVVTHLDSNVGMSQGRAAIQQMLLASKAKKMKETSLVPLNISVSEKTVTNYMSALALHPEVTVSKNVLDKTNQRHIADHSLNNAITFLMIVAANHYILGMECPPHIKTRL